MAAVNVIVEAEGDDRGGELYCPRCENTFAQGRVCPRDGGRLIRLSGQLDPIIGRSLEGRFTVLEKLGQGGMGAVYRARQHSVDREVAVKVVHGSLTTDPEAIKRFLREAKLTSRLSHPNAVGVLDFGQSDGLFYLVMELVAGITLDRAIKDEIKLAPNRVVRIGTQICDALEAAHALSIVHRDLKPSNIMLMPGGRDFVKVLDFGLAKLLEADENNNSDSSVRGGSVLGTPGYMPPERMTTGATDPRGDLYSLGCTLYLAASGRMPFRAQSAAATTALQTHQQAPPVMGVPEPLAAVIDRLIARDPDARYQTAAEAREALEIAAEEAMLRSSAAIAIPRTSTGPIPVPVVPGVTGIPGSIADAGSAPVRAPTEPPVLAPLLPHAVAPLLGGYRRAVTATPVSGEAFEDGYGSTMGLTRRRTSSRKIAIAAAIIGGVLALGVVAATRGNTSDAARPVEPMAQPRVTPPPVTAAPVPPVPVPPVPVPPVPAPPVPVPPQHEASSPSDPDEAHPVAHPAVATTPRPPVKPTRPTKPVTVKPGPIKPGPAKPVAGKPIKKGDGAMPF